MIPQNAMRMPITGHSPLASEGGMPDLKAMAAAVGGIPGGHYPGGVGVQSMQGQMPRVTLSFLPNPPKFAPRSPPPLHARLLMQG